MWSWRKCSSEALAGENLGSIEPRLHTHRKENDGHAGEGMDRRLINRGGESKPEFLRVTSSAAT